MGGGGGEGEGKGESFHVVAAAAPLSLPGYFK